MSMSSLCVVPRKRCRKFPTGTSHFVGMRLITNWSHCRGEHGSIKSATLSTAGHQVTFTVHVTAVQRTLWHGMRKIICRRSLSCAKANV